MNLEQIKNDYAVSVGFENWRNLFLNTSECFESFEYYENELMILAQKECLKRASENANLNKYDCDEFGIRYHNSNVDGVSLENGSLYEVNKESITNENNIIK